MSSTFLRVAWRILIYVGLLGGLFVLLQKDTDYRGWLALCMAAVAIGNFGWFLTSPDKKRTSLYLVLGGLVALFAAYLTAKHFGLI